mmetsp:Transcript_24609/g.70786  ORF Transcript_24609/g.70786 Transcript_24609/m.70786 type:complete len:276 (+) Transcript_24609:532-1359(+)
MGCVMGASGAGVSGAGRACATGGSGGKAVGGPGGARLGGTIVCMGAFAGGRGGGTGGGGFGVPVDETKARILPMIPGVVEAVVPLRPPPRPLCCESRKAWIWSRTLVVDAVVGSAITAGVVTGGATTGFSRAIGTRSAAVVVVGASVVWMVVLITVVVTVVADVVAVVRVCDAVALVVVVVAVTVDAVVVVIVEVDEVAVVAVAVVVTVGLKDHARKTLPLWSRTSAAGWCGGDVDCVVVDVKVVGTIVLALAASGLPCCSGRISRSVRGAKSAR